VAFLTAFLYRRRLVNDEPPAAGATTPLPGADPASDGAAGLAGGQAISCARRRPSSCWVWSSCGSSPTTRSTRFRPDRRPRGASRGLGPAGSRPLGFDACSASACCSASSPRRSPGAMAVIYGAGEGESLRDHGERLSPLQAYSFMLVRAPLHPCLSTVADGSGRSPRSWGFTALAVAWAAWPWPGSRASPSTRVHAPLLGLDGLRWPTPGHLVGHRLATETHGSTRTRSNPCDRRRSPPGLAPAPCR